MLKRPFGLLRFLILFFTLAPLAHAQREEPPWLLWTDPAVLAPLLPQGASLSLRLGGTAGQSNRLLLQNPIYAALVRSVDEALFALRIRDPQLAPGMRTAHRLFDAAYLRAETASFELIGLVNRFDRRPFDPRHCGEIRLVYRLAYAVTQGNKVTRSRLPFTINLVYFADDENGGTNCERVATLLRQPPSALFAGKMLARERLKSLEINFQSVRWPSTVRPDLAGHAEYVLRVFHLKPGGMGLDPAPLENTPDVERLLREPAEKKALLDWLLLPENLERIDEGTVVLPERFLTQRTTSYAPRGLARLANRPFRQLFAPSDFAAVSFQNRRHVRSPVGLLRRLDGLSCAGCHQSRSVAGFHLIGADKSDPDQHNGILVAASPHLLGELPRRENYVQALLSGKKPDAARPLSERADSGEGGYGSHCGLGDAGLLHWRCHAGFVCTPLEESSEVGTCLPLTSEVGDPCEIGALSENRDPHRDRIPRTHAQSCPTDSVCQSNYAGFPAGMCSLPCESLPKGALCGGIPQLRGFNDCLARRRPFADCIRENVRPSGLRACDAKTPCRDDYICASTSQKSGVCMPPYFLFQMRVDGHPPP